MSPSYFWAFLNISAICLAIVSVALIPSVRMLVQLNWRVLPSALQRALAMLLPGFQLHRFLISPG